jgi:hypothetical protein
MPDTAAPIASAVGPEAERVRRRGRSSGANSETVALAAAAFVLLLIVVALHRAVRCRELFDYDA